jgi:hypothetical protein
VGPDQIEKELHFGLARPRAPEWPLADARDAHTLLPLYAGIMIRRSRGRIFGTALALLHEPARSRDSEDVQIVLDTTADEPAITAERICRAHTGPPAAAIEE